jgi:hypothetical protein
MVGMKGSLVANLVMRIDEELTPSGSAPAGISSVKDLSADFIIAAGDSGGVVFVDVVGGSVCVVFSLVVTEGVEFCEAMLVWVVVMEVLPLVSVVVIFAVLILVLVVNCVVLVFTGVVFDVSCLVLVIEELPGDTLQDRNAKRRMTSKGTIK